MGTSSTMKSLSEILGMMLPRTSDIPATHGARRSAAEATGERIVAMVHEDLRPSQLLTRPAFENAMCLLGALGGSTNALLHLTAIAGRRGIALRPRDFAAVFKNIPLLVDIQPTGQYNMDDFFGAGGVAATIRTLFPLIDTSCLTATGKTIKMEYGENAVIDHRVIHSLDNPLAPGPTLAILFGSLAPDGSVVKTSAGEPQLRRHRGRAVVFSGYEDMIRRVNSEDLNVDAESILILRESGPVGVPGMPEWGAIPIPNKLLRQGIRDMVRISDARMSGTGYGTVILHVAPESAVGGPLALVQDGDEIMVDVEAGRLDLLVSVDELERRRRQWQEPQPVHLRGYLRLFAEHVLQAPEGCDLDFLRPTSTPALKFIEPTVGRS